MKVFPPAEPSHGSFDSPFSPEQEALLKDAVDRIIPPDDYPGGAEAGVVEYLARQFCGDLAAGRPEFCACVEAIEAESRARFGSPFCNLAPADQDAVLSSLENGEPLTSWPADPKVFFRRLIDLAMEGYYGDPGNGGNREQAAWRMIGFVVTDSDDPRGDARA